MIRILGKQTVKSLSNNVTPMRNANAIIPSVTTLPFGRYTESYKTNFSSRRYNSTKINSKKTPAADELPSFKKLIMIGLAGTAVFVFAVRSLDQNKPKISYSEEEYQQVMNGLKRKVAVFQPGEIDMQLTTLPDVKSAKDWLSKKDDDISTINFIDPKDIVDSHKNNSEDRYRALLENVYTV